jgi:hypothetical protein
MDTLKQITFGDNITSIRLRDGQLSSSVEIVRLKNTTNLYERASILKCKYLELPDKDMDEISWWALGNNTQIRKFEGR